MALLETVYSAKTDSTPVSTVSGSDRSPVMVFSGAEPQSGPESSLSLFAFPPLIVIFQSKESEAAKSLIQEVFLLCSCIKKVTVVQSFIPDERTAAAYTGFNI